VNKELKAYFCIQAKIAAAFNFFINGMIASMIYHAANEVPTDVISIGIDLAITCLFTSTITAYVIRHGLKSTGTAGVLPPANGFVRFLAKLFRFPLGFGILTGLAAAAALFAIAAPAFALLNITSLPFYLYVLLKSFFSLVFGAGITIFSMYAGICKTK